jgi:hypothetical protein
MFVGSTLTLHKVHVMSFIALFLGRVGWQPYNVLLENKAS